MMKQLLLLCLIFLAISGNAQFLSPQVDSIPLRDGKKLSADIYIPSGCTSCPTILVQTPYNRLFYRWGLPLGIGINLNSSPYNFVIVDWRGFYGSVAATTTLPDRGEDGYDIIDYISQQPWNNGKVGTWGPSALGKVQYQTAREQHPNHTCAVPLVAGPQFDYLEYFPGGVFRTEYVEQLDALGYGLSSFLLANPVKNATWNFLESSNFYPSSIATPMLIIGGWYDHNTELILEIFNGIKILSPLSVRNNHRLVIGPWAHGGNGSATVGTVNQGELFFPEAEGWSDSLALKFFEYHLLNQANGWDLTAPVTYFQMGENVWNSSAEWPTSDVSSTPLFFGDNNSLGTSPPNFSLDQFISDPRFPSPTVGGATLHSSLDQGPFDQSLVEQASNVLSYQSPVLGQDVVLKGTPKAKIYLQTDQRDVDIALRLTDVYPDGRSMLLSEGIRRLRFRNGYLSSDTLTSISSQTIHQLDIDLLPVSHTFLAGHQIRLIVSGSNYPRFDLNLQNGGAMYVQGDTLIAEITIHKGLPNASYLDLPLIDFVGAISENLVDEMHLYPVPSQDVLFLGFNDPEKQLSSYRIFNSTGVLMKSGHLQKGRIEIDELINGLYLLEVSANDQKKYFSKFLKTAK